MRVRLASIQMRASGPMIPSLALFRRRAAARDAHPSLIPARPRGQRLRGAQAGPRTTQVQLGCRHPRSPDSGLPVDHERRALVRAIPTLHAFVTSPWTPADRTHIRAAGRAPVERDDEANGRAPVSHKATRGAPNHATRNWAPLHSRLKGQHARVAVGIPIALDRLLIYKERDMPTQYQEQRTPDDRSEKNVDESVKGSFPASDPPRRWWGDAD